MTPARAVLRGAASRLLSGAVGRTYAIGIYEGPSPLALAPAPAVSNPVLTAGDVTDAVATSVADPFMIRVDGTWHMFFEVVRWRGGGRKGVIAVATSPDARAWSYRGVVLEEPFHLSYPYVFSDGSDLYLIPESSAAGAVRLYRAAAFPARWEHVKDLVTGPVLVDSSVFRHAGRWWMLTETDPAHGHGTLRLFHARELPGPWEEHPRSPIVRGDPGRARPGGRVVCLGGSVIRFAQDCARDYGSALRAFAITELGPDAYGEVEVAPSPVLAGSGRGWNRSGMHHVDAHPAGPGRWLACVDGWRAARGPQRVLLDWTRGARRRIAAGARPSAREASP